MHLIALRERVRTAVPSRTAYQSLQTWRKGKHDTHYEPEARRAILECDAGSYICVSLRG